MAEMIITGAILILLVGLAISFVLIGLVSYSANRQRTRAMRANARLNLEAQKAMQQMLNEAMRIRTQYNDSD